MFTSIRYLFEQSHYISGLIPLLVVRFMPMSGDLLSCSDPSTNSVYLRPDMPRNLLHQAFLREVDNLITQHPTAVQQVAAHQAQQEQQSDSTGVVIPIRRSVDGVG